MKQRINFKTIYLIATITVGLLGLAIGSTYAIFTTSAEINNPISLSTTLTSDDDVFDVIDIVIEPYDTITKTIKIVNSSNSTVNFAIWYLNNFSDNSVDFGINGVPSGTLNVSSNVEYVSEIKTTPKITHKNSAMIGGFPIKTCNFEIYDINGNLDFKDKEITIYKGIEINGVMEYVPQGIFIPRAEQITTNVSQKTISFKDIQDKGQLFSDKYESLLVWSNNETHTGLEIVQEICTKLGIELETTDFNWYDYDFRQPNFDETTTYREVISRLAEIGGAVAFINRNGKLAIKNQYNTNHTVSNSRYIKLSKEQQFGLINVVTLGKKDMNNDISYPTIKPENVVEWKILDNPFVDLYKEEMINTVANYIMGMSIIPFELTDFVDGFCYDLNDIIKITDKKGNFFNGVILNYETTSRIRSKIGADVQEKSTTDYKLAGSSKENTNKIKLDVDHIKKEINAVVETQNEQSSQLSQVTQTVNDYDISIKNVQKSLETTNGTIETLEGKITDMNFNFSTKGLSIGTSTDPNNSLLDNFGIRVYNYAKLNAIFNNKGSGIDKLIVTGTAQIGYLKFVKSTKNNKKVTKIFHLKELIEDLEDLEV